jgi:nitrogen fixation protein FixH
MMEEKGKLTGWHVLIILCLFFGVMIAVNIAFTVFAVKSFPGEQVEQSYETGLRYNETLAQNEKQAALGWQVQIGFEKNAQNEAKLVGSWRDKEGELITGLNVSALITRPASDQGMRHEDLSGNGPGRYEVDLNGLAPGQWKVVMLAVDDNENEFRAEKQLSWFGWSDETRLVMSENNAPVLQSRWSDKNNAPLNDLSVFAKITRTGSDDPSRPIQLKADELGVYKAELDALEAGDWDVEITARGDKGERKTVLKTLTWQH